MKKKLFFLRIPKVFPFCLPMLLLMSGLFFSENVWAQSAGISVSVKNAPLTEIFNIIENQSDYTFVFDSQSVDVTHKVTVKMQNSNI